MCNGSEIPWDPSEITQEKPYKQIKIWSDSIQYNQPHLMTNPYIVLWQYSNLKITDHKYFPPRKGVGGLPGPGRCPSPTPENIGRRIMCDPTAMIARRKRVYEPWSDLDLRIFPHSVCTLLVWVPITWLRGLGPPIQTIAEWVVPSCARHAGLEKNSWCVASSRLADSRSTHGPHMQGLSPPSDPGVGRLLE